MNAKTTTENVRVDTFETYDEALQMARQIRERSGVEGGMIARVARSPYHGYVVVSLPAEVYADLVSEGIPLPKLGGVYDKIPA